MKNQSKFREWLYKNRYTLGKFCELLNISRGHFFKILKGKHVPKPLLMSKIEEATKGEFSTPEDLWD